MFEEALMEIVAVVGSSGIHSKLASSPDPHETAWPGDEVPATPNTGVFVRIRTPIVAR